MKIKRASENFICGAWKCDHTNLVDYPKIIPFSYLSSLEGIDFGNYVPNEGLMEGIPQTLTKLEFESTLDKLVLD